ncbi:hypothetical protein BBP40_006619 [Aspergillus hancockii]|nr:hypothetical protein BBP40_006619 [Aspergillus hancockii]
MSAGSLDGAENAEPSAQMYGVVIVLDQLGMLVFKQFENSDVGIQDIPRFRDSTAPPRLQNVQYLLVSILAFYL